MSPITSRCPSRPQVMIWRRATAHSFEGKVFTIVACSTVSEEIIDAMSDGRPQNRDLLSRPNSAWSGVIDPHGNLVGEALIDKEGIVYAEIDLGDCIRPKLMHDITGGYNRFDIFNLTVDRTPLASARFVDEASFEGERDEEKPL